MLTNFLHFMLHEYCILHFAKSNVLCHVTDDAKEKVDLTEKWNNLSVEGKNETDVEKEIGKPRPDDLTIKRAKKIIKKLNKDPESVS